MAPESVRHVPPAGYSRCCPERTGVTTTLLVAVNHQTNESESKWDFSFFVTLFQFQVGISTYFWLHCASHTSIPHGHSLSTDTAGCIHLRQSFSTFLQYGRTSCSPSHCNGLIEQRKAIKSCYLSMLKRVSVCVYGCLTPWGAGNASISLAKACAVQHHPALVRPLPRLPNDIRRCSVVVIAAFSWNTKYSRD